ncbi:hypothetical protein ACSER5_29270, partial [Pseudomonas aeruginosa]
VRMSVEQVSGSAWAECPNGVESAVYNPDTEFKGVAELILGKHRNGEIGTVRTAFIGKETRFAPLAPEHFRSFD